MQLYEAIAHALPHVLVGFAGGLTGDNVWSRVHSLRRALGTTNFCIDAEGGLRDKITDAYGDDLLNPEKVSHYVSNAFQAYTDK